MSSLKFKTIHIDNSHVSMIFAAFAKYYANVRDVLSEFTLELALSIARISVYIELHVSMYHVYVCITNDCIR